jgi:glycosyltransferase involved in cell wall biosynthesis
MPDQNSRPLVSFCQMYFNQEKFIEESLNSILAQTYSPLEIIISDDASRDGTWQKVTSILAKYTGPHKIITNRNEKNLGIIGNWNKLCSLSSGELLVKGDGDDISAPYRVERTVREWLKYNKEPMLLSSSCNTIDMQGNRIGELKVPIDGWDERDPESICNGWQFFHPGPSAAFNRKLFDSFGTITHFGSDIATYEGRAVMLGRLVGIKDALVSYRVGSGYTTGQTNYRASLSRSINHGLKSRYQLLEDLEYVRQSITPEHYALMKGIFERSAAYHQLSLQLWNGSTFKERYGAFKKLWNKSATYKIKYIWLALLLPQHVAE